MIPAAACLEPDLDAWLADPLIRDVMASDRVTETDLILLIRGVASRREAAASFSPQRFGDESMIRNSLP
jgi:hypothetical protein